MTFPLTPDPYRRTIFHCRGILTVSQKEENRRFCHFERSEKSPE
jgi:hypothetical protein